MLPSFKLTPLVSAIIVAVTGSVSQAQVLEEVIVTAQKRAESLQDVPISVSAIQGGQLQDNGIFNMAALADYVPNLLITEAPVNTNIYIRGVGSGNNPGFEQSVGLYIDGIYMSRGSQYRSGFVDVERVEVLRGPQGTLFGKNTIAGTVNITTASPDPLDPVSGAISASVESNDGRVYEGYVSGAITDTFAARLGFKYRESDGFVDNTYLNTNEPEIEEGSYRITLVWEPSDNLGVNLKYTNTELDRVGGPFATWLYLDPASRDAQFPNRSALTNIIYQLTDDFYPELATESTRDYVSYKDNGFGRSKADGMGIGTIPDGSESNFDYWAMNINYDMGGYTLTSVSGWSEYDTTGGLDVDGLPLQIIYSEGDEQFEQFSQELRITSPGDEFFDYVAGVYYDSNKLERPSRITLDSNMDGIVPEALGVNSLFTLLTGGVYQANQIARNHYYELETESWAAFGQGTFNFSPDLRLTVGLRYTQENKDVVSKQFLSDDLTGLDNPSDNVFLHLLQAQIGNVYAFNYKEDRSTDRWIPSLNLQWDVSDDSMLYAGFSQGFKSGGFTGASDGAPAGVSPGAPCIPGSCDSTVPNEDFEFDDEEVNAFELGGKHTLLDGGMTLNWAAFYTEYDNLQTSIFDGITYGVTNASQSEITGFEAELMWLATANLRVGVSVAWLDAQYNDFDNAPCTVIQTDADPLCGTPQGVSLNSLSGEPTLFASDSSASLVLDYNRPLNAGFELFGGGEVNYRDDYNSSGDNDPLDRIDAYTKVNMRVGLRGDHWEFMAYGRNVFDELVFNQSYDTPLLVGSHSGSIDEGRVWGARLKYSF